MTTTGAPTSGSGSTSAASTDSPGTNEPPPAPDASLGQLLGRITTDLSTLMRQELELAKAELLAEVKKAGQAAGMFGGAGFGAYMLVLFLSIAGWQFLDNVLDSGLAALIVALVWGVVTAVLAVLGRSKAQQISPTPERTIETAKQVPAAMTPSDDTTRSTEETR